MTTPAYMAATTGSPPLATQVNQLLGAHAITYVYSGSLFASQSTTGSGAVDSNGLYIAQQIQTGSSTSTIGRVVLTLSVTGSPAPLTLQIQPNSGGAPSGTALASTVVPPNWSTGSAAALSIPLPATGLAASTTYWIVARAVGDASDYFAFSKSNQTSGASTSTNGTSWTAQAYGLLFSAYDLSAIPPLVHAYADAGARWTTWNWTGALPAGLQEWTQGQTATGYLSSSRTLTYSGSSLTAVA
jgi:hypothetical protein